MKKHTLYTLLSIPAAIGLLAGIKFMQFDSMMKAGENYQPPALLVTYASVQELQWESLMHAVGTVEAEDGIVVQAELPGKITKLAFTPGATVKEGDLLVQQDISIEQTSLRSAEAAAELARSNLQRAQRMIKQNGVSASDFDTSAAQAKQSEAQVENVKAQMAKKSIRAPFAGRLGVRQVSIGQDLRDGDPIVTLQKLDPIMVNFSLPQRDLARLQTGLTVRVYSADFPDLQLQGTITAINPSVEKATRNVKVQAQLRNPGERLLPGMFVEVDVVLPDPQKVLAIPATAILYAPYGDSVFVIEDRPEDQGGGKIVRQQIVKTGISRGDFIAITQGLQPNATVVSTGTFKLQNGQVVTPDNTHSPEFSLTPKPDNS
ncbi:MAG TPA: efflux RND transporter periplasmic adaptor subunit [Candidatus Kapabacteria bacterium]|nr:efflux RND transporter periplasmic adaptor subunit [Candidatus Kapabacteria bacterium]